MSLFTGFVLYMMIFWLLIFAVLPWGNRAPDDIETGNATSAPANPRIKQKFMVTAILSAFIWCIVAALIHFEIIDFYSIAKSMTEEDLAP